MTIAFESIGLIRTPFTSLEGMPIQPKAATGIKGKVILDKAFESGLADLEGFSHIILIYYLHKSDGFELKVIPFLDTTPRGIFSTRAPKRPNAIGMSVVRLTSIEENTLFIENVDMLDGTPLLDIKPYVPEFDTHEADKRGWVGDKTKDLSKIKSDKRFK